MNTWRGSIALHKHTTHPRTYKHLHPSQLALVAILRHRNSITYQDIKEYKDRIDIERPTRNVHTIQIRIPNMSPDLYNQFIRTKYASSLVGLALTITLDHITTLSGDEQDAYLHGLFKEYRSYKNSIFPHFSAGNS